MLVDTEKPDGFIPDFVEVACCVRSEKGGILLLLNKDCKWELPKGKAYDNLTVDDSALRVLREHTGLILGRDQLEHKAELFCSPRFVQCRFVCHVWLLGLKYEGEIATSSKYLKHLWLDTELALRSLDVKWHMQRFIKLAVA